MCPILNNYEQKVRNAVGETFTIKQVREFEREMDKAPTGTNMSYHWVDNKTNKPINFSY